jgi:hypothetical protein
MITIDIDPNCYLTSTSPTYSKVIGAMYTAGNINKAVIIIEIDSSAAGGLVLYPPLPAVELSVGRSSRRNVFVTQRAFMLDETYLQYLATDMQTSFMFVLAGYVARGLVRVLDHATGNPRTAASIMGYAVNGVWV